jgi:hypothetical protein
MFNRQTLSIDLTGAIAASSSSNARAANENRVREAGVSQPIVNHFDLTGLTVRNADDINKIAEQLYQKQQIALRGRGVRNFV